ncbi:MAG TPA: hypothetical protein PK209_11830 [Saprospiraceae bacterium]|nr:hypothetical protein [Saprospiraceae bacterium]
MRLALSIAKALWYLSNAKSFSRGRGSAQHYFTNENSLTAIGFEVRPYFSQSCYMET